MKTDKSVPLHKALNVFSRASEGVFCQREEVWFPTRLWPWCGHSHLFVHSQDTLWNAVDRGLGVPVASLFFSLLGVVTYRWNMDGFSAHKNTKGDKCRWYVSKLSLMKAYFCSYRYTQPLKHRRTWRHDVSGQSPDKRKTKHCAFCPLVTYKDFNTSNNSQTYQCTHCFTGVGYRTVRTYFHHCKYCVSHPKTANPGGESSTRCRLPACNVRIRWQERNEEKYTFSTNGGLLGCCTLTSTGWTSVMKMEAVFSPETLVYSQDYKTQKPTLTSQWKPRILIVGVFTAFKKSWSPCNSLRREV
jgi:hypothetical protein